MKSKSNNDAPTCTISISKNKGKSGSLNPGILKVLLLPGKAGGPGCNNKPTSRRTLLQHAAHSIPALLKLLQLIASFGKQRGM